MSMCGCPGRSPGPVQPHLPGHGPGIGLTTGYDVLKSKSSLRHRLDPSLGGSGRRRDWARHVSKECLAVIHRKTVPQGLSEPEWPCETPWLYACEHVESGCAVAGWRGHMARRLERHLADEANRRLGHKRLNTASHGNATRSGVLPSAVGRIHGSVRLLLGQVGVDGGTLPGAMSALSRSAA